VRGIHQLVGGLVDTDAPLLEVRDVPLVRVAVSINGGISRRALASDPKPDKWTPGDTLRRSANPLRYVSNRRDLTATVIRRSAQP
jgi:hypothetical protein